MGRRALGLMGGMMLVAYAALAGPTVHAASLRPDQQAFMATYRELVETNTELSDGDCTLAAQRMGARLAAAGLPAADITVFSVPDHPREGGLVAVLPAASGQHRRPILLLAHIDVVEARAADWQSDPFRLTEKDGYFYGRGASDDKAMAASWVDTLVRLRQQHRRLARPVKLALTCGEETEGAFNGAQWLSTHQRGLIDAAFALNEGGAGQLDAAGHRLFLGVEAEEKARQDFRLEAKGEGGHSAMPAADNAIARLAAAVGRVAALDFPVRLDSVSRAYLAARARLAGGADAAAISAFLAHPEDPAAQAPLRANRSWNAVIHTTCTPTQISGGSAKNALPERAIANINCRILPGETRDGVAARLAAAIADPAVAISMPDGAGPTAVPVPLDEAVMAPIRQVAARYYPGVPVIPTLVSGSTDGAFLGAAGIPTYGVPSFFYDADFGHIHGVNERIRVDSVLTGRDMLYDLVVALAGG